MEFATYARQDLTGVVRLCDNEGWPLFGSHLAHPAWIPVVNGADSSSAKNRSAMRCCKGLST